MKGQILVVDDEEGIREFVAESLVTAGHEVDIAEDGAAALQLCEQRSFDAVVTDLKMPNISGMELLAAVREKYPDTLVLVLTAHGTIETAVEAMKRGAFDYLQKPIQSPEVLRLHLKRALEHRRLALISAARDSEAHPPLSYGASAMVDVQRALEKVAPTAANVLLLGESGTGKEVAARLIHRQSKRASAPFVALNCAALTETLLESELFGHEKGAFTGADARRRGKIELAAGGTFFLDEVGELRPEIQAKLLRVLQEGEFERLGGDGVMKADVRWIAATNRDLSKMVREGQFREDLYHRLAVFPIQLPALRDRQEDLIPLSEFLLGKVAAEVGRPELRLSSAAKKRIETNAWPGNIRALRNALERASILAEGKEIAANDLWLDASAALVDKEEKEDLVSLEQVERAAIARALTHCSGNRQRTAERLGIGLRTLYEKLKKFDLS